MFLSMLLSCEQEKEASGGGGWIKFKVAGILLISVVSSEVINEHVMELVLVLELALR